MGLVGIAWFGSAFGVAYRIETASATQRCLAFVDCLEWDPANMNAYMRV